MQKEIRACLSEQLHPLRRVAVLTEGYSGSDLVEVCKRCAHRCALHWAPTDPARPSGACIDEVSLLCSICEVRLFIVLHVVFRGVDYLTRGVLK
jgi:AAA+ lid domain